MVHCNNGASEIDAWARMFRKLVTACGAEAVTCLPETAEQAGYARYLEQYCRALNVEETAVRFTR